MNHIYRTLWNARTLTWTAVAENATAHGKPSGSVKRAATVAGAAFSAAALGAAFAPGALAQPVPSVVVSPAGPGNTGAYVAPNGVTVVNIATPNAAGLSHNRFTGYNVNPAGLVLNNGNNAVVARQSQLAGQVTANMNLTTQAGVVLNEVVGNNRSTLAGFTEMLGGRADVVLANPYGITCTGCGFINTDRVVLTTGSPFLAANGGLGGFSVGQGDILITGNGLNASAQQVLDLVTRSLRVEAPVNGNDVSVVTGANQWNFASRGVTGAATPTGGAPVYAVDTSALGGMYANRIRLLATEAGVGVRMAGDAAASASDFTLSAAGRIELQNRISAAGEIAVATTDAGANALALADARLTSAGRTTLAATGGAALAGGSLVAGTDLSVSAAGLLDSAGIATLADDNVRHAGGTLDASTTGAAVLGGTRWSAAGNWNGRFGSLATTAATQLASRDGTLIASATNGDLALGLAVLQSAGDLRLSASGRIALASSGVAQSRGGELALAAGGGISSAGTLTADAGSATLRANGDIAHSGSLHAARDIDIADRAGAASQAVVNTGSVIADGALRLKGAAVVNAAGATVQAQAGSAVSAANIDNAGRWLLSQRAGASDRLEAAGALNNAGTLQSAGSAALGTGSVANTGSLLAAADLNLATSGRVENGATLQAGNALRIDAGGSVANGAAGVLKAATLDLSAGQGLSNAGIATADAGAGTLRVGGTLANSGQLHAAGALDIADRQGGATQAVVNSGRLIADGALRLKAGAFQNTASGWTQAASTTASAGSIDNAGSWLLSTGAGADRIDVAGLLTNGGTLQGADRIGVTAGALVNAGKLLAATRLDATTAGDFTNAAGASVQAGTALDVASGGMLANGADGVMRAQSLVLTAGAGLANAGTLSADTGTATMRVDGAVTNSGAVFARQTLDLADRRGGASQALTNTGVLLSEANVALKVAALANRQAGGNAASGRIQAAMALDIQAASLENAGGMQAGEGLAARTASELTNTGLMQAATKLDLSSGGAFINATTGVLKAGALQLGAGGGLTNAGLASADGGDAVLRVNGMLANTGELSATGSLDIDDLNGAATQAIVNSGRLLAARNLSVRAGDVTNTGSGFVQAAASSQVAAASLDNAGTWLLSTQPGGVGTVAVGGRLANSGTLQSEGAATMVAGSLANSGVVVSGGALAASTTGAFANTGAGVIQATTTATLDALGQFDNAAGALVKADALALSANGLANAGILTADRGAATLRVNGTLANAGTVYAQQGLDIADRQGGRGGNVANTGVLLSDAGFVLKAASLSNAQVGADTATGRVQAASGTRVAASSLDNAGTWLLSTAGGAANTIEVDQRLGNTGKLQGSGGVTVTAGSIDNAGTLYAVDALRATTAKGFDNRAGGIVQTAGRLDLASGGVFQNRRGALVKAGTVALTAGGLDNAGTLAAMAGTTTLRVDASIDNRGTLYASGALDIADRQGGAGESFANSGLVLTDAALALKAAALSNTQVGTDAASGRIQSATRSDIAAASLSNSGVWLLSTRAGASDSVAVGGKLDNTGTMQGAGDVALGAASVQNAGVVYAGGALGVTSLGRIDNQVGAIVQADGRLDLNATGEVANAASALIKGAGVALASSGLDNDGTLVASTGAAVLRVDGRLDNAGTLYAAQRLDIADRQAGAGATLANTGRMLTDADMVLRARDLTNARVGQDQATGRIQSATGSDVAVANLTNGGAWLLSKTSAARDTVTASGTLTNTGAMQGAGSAVYAAATIANAGTLVAGGDLGATATTLANAATGTVQAGGALSVAATTLANQASGSVAGRNLAQGRLIGDRLALTATTLSNDGIVQGGAGKASSVAVGGTLTNGATGVVTLATTASGGGTVGATRIVNDGALQSVGELDLAVGTGGIASAGTVYAGGDLAMKSRATGGDYTADIGGVMESGRLLSVSGASATSLNVGAAGSVVGSRVDATLGNVALANGATLSSVGDLALTANRLTLAGAKSAVLGSSGGGSGVTRLTIGSALTNNGLLFSSGDLVVGAPSIVNATDGGIAALGSATVRATTGDLTNQGALYAGRTLSVLAESGTLTNAATLKAYQGTIDAGERVELKAATLVNQSTIDSGGSVAITATTLRNEVFGGDSRTYGAETARSREETSHRGQGYLCNNPFDGDCYDQHEYWSYKSVWSKQQSYAAGAPGVKPQISGNGEVALTFHAASNLGGTISGGTMRLTGTGTGATFVNDDLALNKISYVRTWTEHTQYKAAGPLTYFDRRTEGETITNTSSPVSSLGAGIYATSLKGSGFSLTNNGATAQPDNSALSGAAKPASVDATPGRTAGVGALAGTVGGADALGATSFGGVQGASGKGATGFGPTADAGVAAAAGFAGAGGATTKSGTTATATPGAASLVSATVTGVRTVSGQNAISFLTANADSGVRGTTFNGVTVPLPANPNGLFVVATAPSASYLVETNPRYQVGAASVGSDYLANLLGYDADTLVRRLGDASYEAYLIRQQLVAQTGRTVLDGYRDANLQVERLMSQAASESRDLGLTYGRALTPAQQANLSQDMVWMVQTEVNGQVVLAPVVYLSAQTRASITGGAVITAENADLSLTSLTNSGGTIGGTRTLSIVSVGDITNTSGTITGGNVALSSTGGGIVNQTASSGSGGDLRYVTDLGRTASITSTGTLSLDAARDITNLGASVGAGGDANLKAGGAITFDTIQNKTADTTRGAYSQDGGTGTTQSTVTTVEQVTSGLTAGGNLSMAAGRDLTLAGTDTKVGGNADLKAGGNLDIVARENTTTTRTESQASGIGMGGALFGSSKTNTDSLSVRNVGSTFEVGGNASLAAKNDVTIQGSSVDVAGKGSISGTNVDVLAGRNYDETNTTTTSTSFLRPVDGGTQTTSGSGAGAQASASGGTASASAGASAQTGFSSSGGLQAMAVDVTKSKTTDLKNVASSVNFGGDMTINATKDVNLVGSKVGTGGDATVNAQNVNVTAATDVATSSTTTTSVAVGLMGSSDNKAGASADASAGATTGEGRTLPGVQAQANAQAGASSENKLDFMQASKTSTDTLDVTHQGSAITSKGGTTINAANALNVTGSQIGAGGDVTVNAKDMTFSAANDVHETRTTSDVTTAGMYNSANAKASAGADAATGLNSKAQASAEASVGVEQGYYAGNTKSSSVEGSTRAVVSGISAGGSVNRNATNAITDVGTSIEAGGNLNQSAKTITSKAAADTTYGSSSKESNTGKIGAFAEASVGASASASTDGTVKNESGAGAGAGVRARYEHENETAQSATSKAVVSSVKVGGSVNSTSSGATSLEGTNIAAGKDVSLTAGSLDYSAAKNTASSSSSTTSAGATVGVDIVNKSVSAGGSYDNAKERESSSTAVVGNVAAGGNLTVKTTGDARLEGTALGAGGAATVETGGNLKFEAAKNTTESKTQDISASADVTVGKKGSAAGSKSSKGFEVEAGYGQSTASSSEAVTGGITSGGPLTVKSGGDATFTGTTLSSGGDASVAAGGNVAFDAARSTSASQEFGVGVSLGASSSKESKAGKSTSTTEGALGLSGNYGQSNSDTAQAAGIRSGGNVSVTSGRDTTFEGTGVTAAGTVAVGAGGAVRQNEARSSSSAFSVGATAEGSATRERTGNAAPGTPGTPNARGVASSSAVTPPAAGTAGTTGITGGAGAPAGAAGKPTTTREMTGNGTGSYESEQGSQATRIEGGRGVTITPGLATAPR